MDLTLCVAAVTARVNDSNNPIVINQISLKFLNKWEPPFFKSGPVSQKCEPLPNII